MTRSEHEKKIWTVLSMLEWATGHFKTHGVPDPRLSIEWLLAEVLGTKRLDLYLNYDRPLTRKELDRLRPMVKRRANHEPLQYITGYTFFMGCRIEVGPGVLIPRPETEQLVEIILQDRQADESRVRQEGEGEATSAKQAVRLLDIGTGSGCIPIALAKTEISSEWECTGIDISDEALEVSRKNAEKNGAAIEFVKADLFNLGEHPEFEGRSFDLIVSNPPYVLPEERASLERQVKEFEPEIALFHEDPVELCRSIGGFARNRLAAGGRIYLECNPLLIAQMQETLSAWFSNVEILKDYDGRDRFIRAARIS